MTKWNRARYSDRWWSGIWRTPPAPGHRLPKFLFRRRIQVRHTNNFRSRFMTTDWGNWQERMDRGYRGGVPR